MKKNNKGKVKSKTNANTVLNEVGGAVWIPEDNNKPPKFVNYKLSSIDVIVKNRLGETCRAHFNFALQSWMMRSKKFCAPVTHWKLIKNG